MLAGEVELQARQSCRELSKRERKTLLYLDGTV